MDKAKDIEEVLHRSGWSFSELMSHVGEGYYDSAIYALSSKDHEEYHSLFQKLDTVKNSNAKTKGNALEELIEFLMLRIVPYNVLRNKRTATNEMDVVLVNNFFGATKLPTYVICECKNYGETVSVTYVGKFYSLLKTANVKIGVMFSIKGISGRSTWQDGKGLCRKIFLKDSIYIIDVSYDDLKKIDESNVTLLSIVKRKVDEMTLDTNIDVSPHCLCSDKDFLNNLT